MGILYSKLSPEAIEKLKARARQKYYENREKKLAYQKEYYENNRADVRNYQAEYRGKHRPLVVPRVILTPEQIEAKRKKYNQDNKEYILETQREYYRNNKETVLARQREYIKKKYATNPQWAMYMSIRGNLSKYFKKAASISSYTSELSSSNNSDRKYIRKERSSTLLGCTRTTLIQHIEQQFTDKMSWDNRGSYWDVDHIIPCQFFIAYNLPLSAACHYTNLQPLDSITNRWIKNSCIIKEYLPKIITNPNAPDDLIDVALVLMQYS